MWAVNALSMAARCIEFGNVVRVKAVLLTDCIDHKCEMRLGILFGSVYSVFNTTGSGKATAR